MKPRPAGPPAKGWVIAMTAMAIGFWTFLVFGWPSDANCAIESCAIAFIVFWSGITAILMTGTMVLVVRSLGIPFRSLLLLTMASVLSWDAGFAVAGLARGELTNEVALLLIGGPLFFFPFALSALVLAALLIRVFLFPDMNRRPT